MRADEAAPILVLSGISAFGGVAIGGAIVVGARVIARLLDA
jgi:hypothetical protein